jgi:hypothetical protein
MQPQFAQHRPVHRVEQRLVVVIPGDYHDLAAVPAQREQGLHDQPLRPRGRRRALEQVPGHQHQVDVLVPRRRDDAAQHGDMLVVPVLAVQDLPDVPVAGVQDLHRAPQNGGGSSSAPGIVANGSAGAAGAESWPAHSPFSLGRVAQAGNGNSTASGTGMSGWAMNIVPGLARVARCR